MPTRRHPRYPTEQWQAWIDEQARSGLSQRIFCGQKGLSKSSFPLWKRHLISGTSALPQTADAEAALFAPVSISATHEPGGDTRGWEIELDLGRRCLPAISPGWLMRSPVQLWLYNQPTDMRRSYDGLAAMVRRQQGQNPLSGHDFLFINRRRTQLKCLYFQAGGYCLWSKRLGRGRFAALPAPPPSEPEEKQTSVQEPRHKAREN